MTRLHIARSAQKAKVAKVVKVTKVAAPSHPFSFDRCCSDCIVAAPVQATVYRCASRFRTDNHDFTTKPAAQPHAYLQVAPAPKCQ